MKDLLSATGWSLLSLTWKLYFPDNFIFVSDSGENVLSESIMWLLRGVWEGWLAMDVTDYGRLVGFENSLSILDSQTTLDGSTDLVGMNLKQPCNSL